MQNPLWQKAVFLDRDGVLNEDPGDYTYSPENFKVLDGVMESLLNWKQQDYKLIVITNQGGIAKGRYTVNEVEATHQYFQGLCIQNGFTIDDFYFCPHHDQISTCLCRKPGSLMIEKALHKYKLNPNECLLIGDKPRDIEAANAAGVRGVLVKTNEGLNPNLIVKH